MQLSTMCIKQFAFITRLHDRNQQDKIMTTCVHVFPGDIPFLSLLLLIEMYMIGNCTHSTFCQSTSFSFPIFLNPVVFSRLRLLEPLIRGKCQDFLTFTLNGRPQHMLLYRHTLACFVYRVLKSVFCYSIQWVTVLAYAGLAGSQGYVRCMCEALSQHRC